MNDMKWEKQGLIIKAEGQRHWMQSHIQNPYAVDMGDCIRVYFTTRPAPIDGLYKSVTAWMDLDRNNLHNVLRISDSPILEYGEPGTFDEHGIMPGSIVKKGDREYWLYYAGWRQTKSVPYVWALGLAISRDGGNHFEKFGNGPIMNVQYNDPYLLAAPRSVFYDKGQWHMLYGSGTGWIYDNGMYESMYLNRHAISNDGINWYRDEKPCVETIYSDESQSACCTIKVEGRYHMFFPYRHSVNFRNKERGYLIGYAYSDDLISWNRCDEHNLIELSDHGWDSEMLCYPHLIELDDKIIMFYCGNGFGVSGMGYASIRREQMFRGGKTLIYENRLGAKRFRYCYRNEDTSSGSEYTELTNHKQTYVLREIKPVFLNRRAA